MSVTTTAAAAKAKREPRNASAIQSGKKLLDVQRLCDFLSIGEATLDRLIADPDERFPLDVGLLEGKRHWTLESIERYVERKAQARAKQNRQ